MLWYKKFGLRFSFFFSFAFRDVSEIMFLIICFCWLLLYCLQNSVILWEHLLCVCVAKFTKYFSSIFWDIFDRTQSIYVNGEYYVIDTLIDCITDLNRLLVYC